jgi:hypothetical protein
MYVSEVSTTLKLNKRWDVSVQFFHCMVSDLYIFISRISHHPENKDEREFSEMCCILNQTKVAPDRISIEHDFFKKKVCCNKWFLQKHQMQVLLQYGIIFQLHLNLLVMFETWKQSSYIIRL